MKRFIVRMSVFILVLVSLMGLLYLLSDVYLNQRKETFLTLKDNVSIIFAGDSNIQCAINDSLISNSINIAGSGEGSLYTNAKLRSLLEYNHNIKMVFLGISFHNISKAVEDLWFFHEYYLIESGKAQNYQLTFQEKALLLIKNPKAYLQGIPDFTLANIDAIKRSYESHEIIRYGGYARLEHDIEPKDRIRSDSTKPGNFEEGKYQMKYLEMISELCRRKSIKLILLNTPKYNRTSEMGHRNIKAYLASIRSTLVSDSLLDLSEMFLADSCFADVMHLNYKGAYVFSKYLDDRIHSHGGDTLDIKKTKKK